MNDPVDDPFLARFTLDASSEEVYWTDRDGRFIYVNDAVCRALGYSRDEMLERSVWDIAPGFPKEGWPAHRDALRAAGSLRLESVQKTRDGLERLVEISATWIEREGREFTCAFSRDISLRRKAEAEARERERWLDDSQKAGGVGCYHFDLVSDHWKCTATMEAIFGIGPDYPKSFEGWNRLVAPDEREAMAAYFTSISASGAGFDREYRIVRACDGQSRWVHGRGDFIRDANGAPVSLIGTIIDITERRHDQEVLRQSEEKFATVFNQAPLLMTISSLETGRYIDVNRKFCDVSGFSREEAIGKSSIELGWITAKDRERLLEGLRRDGRVSNLELTLTGKGARKVICLFNGELISVDGCTMLLSIAIDITDRKRTEEALRGSEARFALFMEHLPAAAFIKDEDGRVLMANRYLQRLSGVSGEMRGRSTAELFPPDIAASMIEADRRALAAGLTVVEESLPDPSCGMRHFQTIKFPVPIEGGGKALLGGVAIEITERKRAEDALRSKERILRALIDANPESQFLMRLDGTVIEANRTFADRIGKPIAEILGRNIRDLQPPDVVARREEWVRQTVASGMPARFEDHIDGRDRDNRFFPAPGPTGEIDMVAGLSIDVTERNRLQEQLIRNQKLESLGVLAGGIAHDFNNILTAILGNLSLSRLMLDGGHPASERLADCERATIRASELTQQLLTFARGGAPVKGTVETGSLIEEVMQFALRGSNVRGIVDLAPGLWCLDADEGQVGQLLNNLFINAKQAMPGGGTLTVRAANVEIPGRPGGALPEGRYVSITVRDEGTGIPAEDIGRIFDPYFSTKPGGSGLGLASVHSIVHRHGGSVEVSSSLGAGTEFVVRLPAAAEKDAGKPQAAPNDALPRGKGRVIVMDDEEMLLRMASMMLEELGYEPVPCTNGDEAVEAYRDSIAREAPCVAVILDLTIPGGMGGKDAAARILELDPGALLVVSSGYSHDPVLADPPAYGFKGAVIKPYALETLATELSRLTNPLK